MAKSTTKFIVIEALDAGGSQTQTDLLVKRLQQERWQPMQFHFPQEDRATGQLIYQKFLLANNRYSFSRREQALLYIQDFYSQAEAMWKVVDSKDSKSIIISDRFCTSTMAYQTIGLSGQARTSMLQWLSWLCFAGRPALPKPDLVIFLDTPVAVSLRRLRQKKRDYFETRTKLAAIRRSYLRLAEQQSWHSLSSVDERAQERSREELHQDIWQVVRSRLAA